MSKNNGFTQIVIYFISGAVYCLYVSCAGILHLTTLLKLNAISAKAVPVPLHFIHYYAWSIHVFCGNRINWYKIPNRELPASRTSQLTRDIKLLITSSWKTELIYFQIIASTRSLLQNDFSFVLHFTYRERYMLCSARAFRT